MKTKNATTSPGMHWIPIEERRPRENQWVVVWNKKLDGPTMAKPYRGRWVGWNGKPGKNDVTHWLEVKRPDGMDSGEKLRIRSFQD